MDWQRILLRATNWVGDAVISLPALRAVRARFPKAHIAVLARPWVADLYARETFADEVIPHTARRGAGDWAGKWRLARLLSARRFDAAILFQNAFEAALLAWLARIPRRIGYARDGRGFLLTQALPLPAPAALPPHQRFYYLEMLRRAGLLDRLPPDGPILLEAARQARQAGLRRFAALGIGRPVIGVSPGAAYGSAKQYLPERFAQAAALVAAEIGAEVAWFGSADDRAVCQRVAGAGHNFAGKTTLGEFIELAAACRLYLTNDSGAMHVAGALGVPTVAVFGATDAAATGPCGPRVRVVSEPVHCAPCLLRQCPTDHRCMTRVPAARVAQAALELLS